MAELPRLNGIIKATRGRQARDHLLPARARSASPSRWRSRSTTASSTRWSTWRGTACALRHTLQYSLNRAPDRRRRLGRAASDADGPHPRQRRARRTSGSPSRPSTWAATASAGRTSRPPTRPTTRSPPAAIRASRTSRSTSPPASAATAPCRPRRYWGVSPARLLQARRRLAARPRRARSSSILQIEDTEGIANLKEILKVGRHRLHPDRRGRPVPGARLPPPVRAQGGARGDGRDRGPLQGSQGRRRPSARRDRQRPAHHQRGLPLPDERRPAQLRAR